MIKRYIWMAVDTDEYELPIAVASSARELGQMLGTDGHNIETRFYKDCNGRINNQRIVRVEDTYE